MEYLALRKNHLDGVVFALREGMNTAGHADQWLGDLLALIAGMFWGLTTVLVRGSRHARVSPEKLLFFQVGVSTITLAMLSLMLGERWVLTFNAFASTSLLLQTVVGAFASYLAWMPGRYTATKISAFAFLTPDFALLFGAQWRKEPATVNLIASVSMVAVGIVPVNAKTALKASH